VDAEAALSAAERAKAEAERAQQRLAEEQAAAEAARARAQASAEEARQAVERAEAEKAELRERLQRQLNIILETRETARGLIVNVSDVLFDTGKHTLKPGAREKLATVAGILLAYPDLSLEVDGHTDNVGEDDYNQALSERRAESVRGYLVQHGIPPSAIVAWVRGITARCLKRHRRRPTAESTCGAGRLRRVDWLSHAELVRDAPARTVGALIWLGWPRGLNLSPATLQEFFTNGFNQFPGRNGTVSGHWRRSAMRLTS